MQRPKAGISLRSARRARRCDSALRLSDVDEPRLLSRDSDRVLGLEWRELREAASAASLKTRARVEAHTRAGLRAHRWLLATRGTALRSARPLGGSRGKRRATRPSSDRSQRVRDVLAFVYGPGDRNRVRMTSREHASSRRSRRILLTDPLSLARQFVELARNVAVAHATLRPAAASKKRGLVEKN